MGNILQQSFLNCQAVERWSEIKALFPPSLNFQDLSSKKNKTAFKFNNICIQRDHVPPVEMVSPM